MTRKYEQRLRADAADQTRRRILDAVHDRLRDAPSKPVSVDEVAKAAGVARSTVYLVFGSRAGLFDALAGDLLTRGGFQRVLDAVRSPDPREHLRGGITGGVQAYAAHRDVLRAITSMAELDAEAVGGSMQRSNVARWRGMTYLAGRLQEHGLLREDVGVEDAAHVLWIATSFDAFDLLYSGRGLDADEVARILVATAERAILS